MNSNSGKAGKVFTLNRNVRSCSTRIGVHVEPEWVFILGRNMHSVRAWAFSGELTPEANVNVLANCHHVYTENIRWRRGAPDHREASISLTRYV
jgi:hypothetical protein